MSTGRKKLDSYGFGRTDRKKKTSGKKKKKRCEGGSVGKVLRGSFCVNKAKVRL